MTCVVLQHAFSNPNWGRYLFLGAVALFFVASGYTTKSMTVKEIKRKAKRLLVPYVVYSITLGMIAVAATCWKTGTMTDFRRNSLLLLAGIAYGRHSVFKDGSGIGLNHFGIAPMWFLPALFLSFVLLFLFDRMPKCFLLPYTMSCLAGTILAFHSGIYLPWSFDLAPIGMLLIAAGRHFQNIALILDNRFPYIDLLAWSAWVAIARFNGFPVSMFNNQFGAHGTASIVAFVLIATSEFILLARLGKRIRWRPLLTPFQAIGKRTLVFLCLQLFIINSCEIMLGNSARHSILSGLIKGGTTLVVCLISARALSIIGKKFPFFKLLG